MRQNELQEQQNKEHAFQEIHEKWGISTGQKCCQEVKKNQD